MELFSIIKKTLLLFLIIQFSASCFASQKDSILIKTENLTELSVAELQKLAEAFENRDDSHYALLCYLTVLNKTKDSKDSELLTERALACKNIGIIYFSRGDYSRSLEYFLSSLKIYENLNDLDGVASQLNNVGTIFFEWGEYEQALEHYQSSFRMLDSLKLKHKFPLIFNNIGGVYLKTGAYEKAFIIIKNLPTCKWNLATA
jgi:tetratricopeptide (TPR) repeat protein